MTDVLCFLRSHLNRKNLTLYSISCRYWYSTFKKFRVFANTCLESAYSQDVESAAHKQFSCVLNRCWWIDELQRRQINGENSFYIYGNAHIDSRRDLWDESRSPQESSPRNHQSCPTPPVTVLRRRRHRICRLSCRREVAAPLSTSGSEGRSRPWSWSPSFSSSSAATRSGSSSRRTRSRTRATASLDTTNSVCSGEGERDLGVGLVRCRPVPTSTGLISSSCSQVSRASGLLRDVERQQPAAGRQLLHQFPGVLLRRQELQSWAQVGDGIHVHKIVCCPICEFSLACLLITVWLSAGKMSYTSCR